MFAYPTLLEIEDGICEKPKSFKWDIDNLVDFDKDKNIIYPYVNTNFVNDVFEGYISDYDLYKTMCKKMNENHLTEDKFNSLINILKHCSINNLYRHSYFILSGLGHPRGCTICMNENKKYGECSSGG